MLITKNHIPFYFRWTMLCFRKIRNCNANIKCIISRGYKNAIKWAWMNLFLKLYFDSKTLFGSATVKRVLAMLSIWFRGVWEGKYKYRVGKIFRQRHKSAQSSISSFYSAKQTERSWMSSFPFSTKIWNRWNCPDSCFCPTLG